MPMRLEGAMLSDTGQVRTLNEDCAAYVLPRHGDPSDRRRAIAIVADGMGGHAAGEIASRIACEVVLRRVGSSGGRPPELLHEAILEANAAILEEAGRDPSFEGMGTTLTAVLVDDGHAYLGHVGDSRFYLWRDHELLQHSDDHSLVAEMVRCGQLSAEEARYHPERNVIFKALGTGPEVEPTIWRQGLPLKPGDVLLLCSDGLTDLVSDDRIAEELQHEPLEACRRLVACALAAGGFDNVTAGVFRIVADSGDPAVAPSTPDTRVPAEDVVSS